MDTATPNNYSQEFDYDESEECERCGGEGWIAAVDGDPSDWMEDTYCGDQDAIIKCRKCNGTGGL